MDQIVGPSHPVHGLVAAANANLVAAAAFEHSVAIWTLDGETPISQFPTIMNDGGDRLALSHDGTYCLAAAYHRFGVARYETGSGRRTWHRPDIRQVQQITLSPDGSRAYCGREKGPLQVLDTSSGETLLTLPGVRAIWTRAGCRWELHDKRNLTVPIPPASRPLAVPREAFAVLDATFSEGALFCSESTGPVRCVALPTGAERWRYRPTPGEHVLHLAVDPSAGRLRGLSWPYREGGAYRLLSWELDTAEPEVIATFPSTNAATFIDNGRKLLLSTGQLISTSTGEVERRLPLENSFDAGR